MVTITASELRYAMQLVHELSGGMIECYDIEDLECPDDELDEIVGRILQEPQLQLWFPGEDDRIEWDLADFLRQSRECETIAEGKLVSLRTSQLALQLVVPVTETAQAVVYHGEPLVVKTDGNVTVQLRSHSLPVAVFASKKGAYGDFYGVVSSYLSIEADFSQFSGERTETFERRIIDAYLFELASSHDAVFARGRLLYEDEEPWWTDEKPEIKLRPLEDANEGVRLFLAASQVQDSELRFFSFYKVLEHFGPTVLNFEAHESLRKKLDSPAALSPNGHFVREVLELAKSFDQRKNDRELIKGVLAKGVDLVGLNNLVPQSFRQPVSYSTSSKELEKYTRDLAERICATRNQVAHAKASYDSHGTECSASELGQFNQFIRAAAAEAIRWYNRLPDHQKVELAADTVCKESVESGGGAEPRRSGSRLTRRWSW